MSEREPADDRTFPVVEEEAFVTKRAVDTDHVRVKTSVDERQVMVRDTVLRGQMEIRRVAFDRQIEAVPAVRQEGGITIIPVFEERLVVEKRLFLVEEIHVQGASRMEPVEIPTTLRRTRVDIERDDLTNQQEDVDGRTQ